MPVIFLDAGWAIERGVSIIKLFSMVDQRLLHFALQAGGEYIYPSIVAIWKLLYIAGKTYP